MGMIQTTEMVQICLRTGTACGMSAWSGGGASAILLLRGVPDEAWIEGAGGQYGKHDHRAEENRSQPGPHRCESLQLHQRDRKRNDVNVQHRPAPDEFHQ